MKISPFRRFLAGLSLCALTATPASVRAAENTNIATVTPQVVIPFMKAAPKLDGVISDGEWQTFHAKRLVSQNFDVLSSRAGEFWIGSDATNLYIAVRSAVHPDAGIVATQEPRGDSDVGEVIYDDSIELWFDNNPGGKTGGYYQIMMNSKGTMYDAHFERPDQIAQKFWRAPLQQAHGVKDGLWTAEFALPLKDLGVTDATKPLAMRIARNYKLGWDQARWEPLVRAFESAETMGKIRFAAGAPVVADLNVQDAEGINVGVELTNPEDTALPVKVRIGYNAQDQPRYFQDWDANLAPGASQKFEYKKPFFTPGNYPAIGEILVTDNAGKTLYHRDFKWFTEPDAKKIWDMVKPQSAAEATQFYIAWLPTSGVLRWRTDFAAVGDRAKVTRARVVVASADKTVGQGTMTVFKNFGGEGQVALPKLADGKYTARLYLDEAAPAAKPIREVVFQHQNSFPWKNNTIGISDEVIPPFTPLVVKDRTVSAILRKHGMTQTGLWSQVRALDKDILSGPMRFEVKRDGKVQTVTANLKFAERKPNRVTALADWKSGGVRGRTESVFDYDGCMKVTLDLTPQDGGQVDSLDLVIPLKNDVARLMHTCGEGARANYGGAVPAGQGEVWNSSKASLDKLIGPFLPYIWLGSEERGLVWFASNDRGWGVDESGKTPALALERDGDTLNLRLRLVQKPMKLEGKRQIVFGLQATPVKPMPEEPNWRRRGVMAGGKFETTVLGMSMYWGSDLYGVSPRNRDFTVVEKIAASKKTGQSDKAFFDNYVKENPDFRNEINYASAPSKTDSIIPYTNLRGEPMYTPDWRVYQDEWKRVYFPEWRSGDDSKGSLDFALTPTKSRQDYLLYYYRELLRHGFDGIYWDNICIYDNENPGTGNGYRRADGLWQTDTDIWEMRELTRRTAVLFHQMGKRNMTMPHMTNANLIPVFSWTTMGLDWEWRYGGTDFQDRFTRDYIRAASLGLQSGNISVALPGITEVTDPAKVKWVERTRIAATIPHEINVWQADALYTRVKTYFYDMGYGTPGCRVYHYWDEKPVATVAGLDAAWIVLENKDSVTLMVSDYSDGGTAQVKLDLRALGLPANYKAVNWEKPDETFTARDGVLSVPGIAKHDFRVLTISKR